MACHGVAGVEELGENAALPQVVHLKEKDLEVWPQYWGITMRQCQDLLCECKSDSRWKSSNTVYDLVEQYIKPKTAGSGLGYALLLNQEQPQEVTVMVSHAWAENAEEFFGSLARSVRAEEAMFICALSLYQCEDSAGPSIQDQLGGHACMSPFYKVLTHIRAAGEAAGRIWKWGKVLQAVPLAFFMISICFFFFPMGSDDDELCIPTLRGCAVGTNLLESEELDIAGSNNWLVHALPRYDVCLFPRWRWEIRPMPERFGHCLYVSAAAFFLMCLSLLWYTWFPRYQGRMVAVPNHQLDLYSRLWCVHEAYTAASVGVPMEMAKTFAVAGTCKVASAKCSNMMDEERIREDMKKCVAACRTPEILGRKAWSSLASAFRVSVRASDELTGEKDVEAIIQHVTSKAERLVFIHLIQWLLPFFSVYVAFGLSSNRWHTFPEGKQKACIGFLSICLSGALTLLAAFWLAKRCQGRPNFWQVQRSAGIMLGLGVVLRFLDCWLNSGHMRPFFWPPIHHCFTFGLLCGGISLALLGIGARLGLGLPFRARLIFFVCYYAAVCLLISCLGTAELSLTQVSASIIWYSCFRLTPMTGFLALVWFAADSWGVQLEIVHDEK
eukprot:TRINITY_DN33687_c0_g1_i1.p1 TRINITY_DN33687_c0_g1~~TRINITY_DN33687_c0_g1_i1.p1  ORF type:complete len:626 (+),score=86.84 TRINITY_DN33687_c0_g1_i1:43-1878(+)